MDPDPLGSVFNASPGSGSVIEYGSGTKGRKMMKKTFIEAIILYPDDLQDDPRLLATMPATQVSEEQLFTSIKNSLA